MRRSRLLALAVLSFAVGGIAHAEITYDEAVCEVKATTTSWSYFQKKLGCLVSCQRGVRSGDNEPADCVAPYAHRTFGCIQGKQGRANGSICSGCSRDTPECYPPDPCPESTNTFLSTIDDVLHVMMPSFYCDDSGSPDGLTALEGKCQDAIAKYSAKAAYQVARCYGRCRQNATKGVVLPEACEPPATDPYTQACLAKYDLPTASRIDRYCTDTGNQPECAPTDGYGWAGLARVTVEGFDSYFYCEN